MPKELRKTAHCLSCHSSIGDFNYCPHCGQLNTDKQVPLHHFWQDLLGDYFTFDSKFFRSILPLLIKPGFLTEQYNSGKRVSYILPLRLYIFITIFFFFTLSLQSKITGSDT